MGPSDGVSYEAEAAGHWAALEEILHRQGVDADAAELRHLPHEVVPSAWLLARIGCADADRPSG
ncbi:hypothetical protein [Haloechinothrix halophila]|uniref:hypothetical protein n=1 Tax=Haloechinothrix halophila TaxID=1069073 RepID=UPI000424B340|nr:hypothetical protein [Haloechinothrix halophila]